MPQESGALGNNIERELKLNKCIYYIFTKIIYSACNSKQVVVFKFSYVKGSIIPYANEKLSNIIKYNDAYDFFQI